MTPDRTKRPAKMFSVIFIIPPRARIRSRRPVPLYILQGGQLLVRAAAPLLDFSELAEKPTDFAERAIRERYFFCLSGDTLRLMTPDQKKFLQKRLRKAVTDQPEFKQLKTLLLSFGGDFIVAPPRQDPDVPKLLKYGFLMGGPILMKPMKASMCHQNIAAVWRKGRKGVVGVATGYALSDDGLWRQHSWAVMRDGVLESTEERRRYFGILLQDSAADHFANCNPY